MRVLALTAGISGIKQMEILIRRLEQAAIAIAGLCIVMIMCIVSADAMLRYGINSPIPWSFEIVTYYLIIISVYFAISSTFRSGDHISINLIRDKLPKRARAWADVICSVLALVVFAIIAYGAFYHAVEAFQRNEYLPGYIVWPAWLSHIPVSIGAFLLVLRLAHHSYTLVKLGRDPFVDLDDEVME